MIEHKYWQNISNKHWNYIIFFFFNSVLIQIIQILQIFI